MACRRAHFLFAGRLSRRDLRIRGVIPLVGLTMVVEFLDGLWVSYSLMIGHSERMAGAHTMMGHASSCPSRRLRSNGCMITT